MENDYGNGTCQSYIKLQDPDRRAGYLATARTKPSLLLKGETPRLIDEWQDAPVLWDAVRMAVDERRAKGQFILTGSTVIDEKGRMGKSFSVFIRELVEFLPLPCIP